MVDRIAVAMADELAGRMGVRVLCRWDVVRTDEKGRETGSGPFRRDGCDRGASRVKMLEVTGPSADWACVIKLPSMLL
jgi:hypothetical protein